MNREQHAVFSSNHHADPFRHGPRGAGLIDLPIAREVSTELPIAPGSGIKGVLREHFRAKQDQDLVELLFGPERSRADSHSGILCPQDAYLLCLPVRSLKGTLARVASPLTLQRYAREAKIHNKDQAGKDKSIPDLFDVARDEVAASETVAFKPAGWSHHAVGLHELIRKRNDKLEPRREKWADHIAGKFFAADTNWAKVFKERFVVVADDTMVFLAQMATDVRARVSLDQNRVVRKGGNWYEESLPAETLLWGVMAAQLVRKISIDPEHALRKLKSETLQMGGKATIGRGVVEFLIEPI
ncbi:MAG: type III-B CRISPR module RAMP protein Cmr4 [Methylococcales bacterium]